MYVELVSGEIGTMALRFTDIIPDNKNSCIVGGYLETHFDKGSKIDKVRVVNHRASVIVTRKYGDEVDVFKVYINSKERIYRRWFVETRKPQ